MFFEAFAPTDPHQELLSAFADCSNPHVSLPFVGAYGGGIVMVVDAGSSKGVLNRWTWLLGDQCRALVTTGFGDVFFWDPSKGVSFLNVQRGEVEFVDAETEWFLHEFLNRAEVVDKILRNRRFERLIQRKRPLSYHEVFILEPWLMLGGEDRDENYAIGKCDVYLDLVGQSHFQCH